MNNNSTAGRTQSSWVRRNKAAHDESFYREALADPARVKPCNQCEQTLHVSNFRKHARESDGFEYTCKGCTNGTSDGGAYRKDKRLQRIYGIRLSEYEALLAEQDGVCAICERTCVSKPSLSVDHHHDSGLVRGLLCSRCNQAIGLLGDSVELVERVAAYLKRHEEGAP